MQNRKKRLYDDFDQFDFRALFAAPRGGQHLRFQEDDIYVTYLITKKGLPKLQLKFHQSIEDHLNPGHNEGLELLTDKNDPLNYLLIKTSKGYKIQRPANIKFHYIQFSFKNDKFQPFVNLQPTLYFGKDKIRMVLPKDALRGNMK